jgi:hypothetical protein
MIAARVAWEEIGWGGPFVRALAAGRLAPAWRVPDLHDLAAAAERPDLSPALLVDLLDEMPAERRAAWEPLRRPTARVVVTGQQPGCVGGALLSLYKAATAVALARRAAAQLGIPVVPLFWNATDDEDFDEIARVAWPDAMRGLLFLEMPAAERRAGGWVGDLPAGLDERAAGAALELLDEVGRARVRACLPAAARDHGDWVAGWLQAIFPDLALLDARSVALRRHGAGLFGRYLERRQAVREALGAVAAGLEAEGATPRVAPESTRTALFLTAERRRRKLPDDDIRPLQAALATAPETLSPNVVLRPLLQDALLPTLAHVVGPAEVDYLLELRPLRALLDVPQPALVPRLTLALVEPEPWRAAVGLGIRPAELLEGPEAALRAAARRAAASGRDDLEGAFRRLHADLDGLRALPEAARGRVERRLRAVQQEIEAQLDDAARARLVSQQAGLANLPAWLAPRDRPQERLVAGLWLQSRWGEALAPRLVELAGAHLDALEARRGEQSLVTL